MRDPQKNHIKIDPATLVLIVSVLILLPLVLTGFFFQ
jgi:preprotein translocase subunit Sec61beta